MRAEAETDIPQIDTIRDIFQTTLKEIFTNSTSCEETELHYFCIEKIEGQEFIYYDGSLLPEALIQSKMAAGYKPLVIDFIKNTLKKIHYILEESEIYIDKKNGRLKKVFWVLFSECLDSNHGKLLLKCTFKELCAVFNQYLKEELNGVRGCEDGRSDSGYAEVTQKILLSAEAQAASYVQGLFAPLNIVFIDNLSGEYYEKSACDSNMIFLSKKAAEHLKVEDLLYCFNGIKFIPANNRLIRKLLQIAREDLYLVLEANKEESLFDVVGVCSESVLSQKLKNKGKMKVPYIRVNVKKHMQWDIFLGDTYIFTSRNGHYKIDRELQEDFMTRKLLAYFGGTEEGYKGLIQNIKRSTKQAHGTMLVIMEPKIAYNETLRLGTKQYGLPAADSQPHKAELIQQEINNLNAIDGCVIFGTDGNLYGIGMILDGIAEESGSLARGARYNSAIKYLSYLSGESKRAMILVVSEDGSVDICTTDDVKKTEID